MVSFTDGMETLVLELAKGNTVQLYTAVEKVGFDSSVWKIQSNNDLIQAKKIVIATNINHATAEGDSDPNGDK